MSLALARIAAAHRSGGTPGTTYFDAVMADAPTAFWRLNESGGTVAVNAANASNNGTVQGGTLLGQTGLPGDQGGGAFAFNSVGDRVTYPSGAITGSSFTLEAWINTTHTGARKNIVGAGDPRATNNGVALYVGSDNCLHCDLSNVAGPNSGVAVCNGAWRLCHVAFTGGTAQLYVDGAAAGSAVAMSPAIANMGASIAYNVSAYPFQFVGRICNVAIYNQALSAARIAARYAQGAAP
ncbi:LamG domain-containing protein [Fulvimonas yonginensis]|uniref:LamG domain-containing protein n=1 Tax=Fulvimonas yonginensis TaxID=1495200 RepID=A0ABU8JB46_9GAMM